MNNEYIPEKNEPEQERARTWEGKIGRRHFRIRWERKVDSAHLHFQAPFATDEDPDGMGNAFAPDVSFVWERGLGPRLVGIYNERLNTLQHEIPAVTERVKRDVEGAFSKLRREWSERRAALQTSQEVQESGPQRVRIEYEESGSLFDDEDATGDVLDQAQAILSAKRTGAEQRRTILEGLRAGTISLEDAERQLDELA